ncbi:MAG: aminomethyl-transferring glycine dehydrogenase subunit GcvPB [SAR324 cluster bacterium]|nr:aminomethyl-transferring glycine dehydrogenase subunit GcvPB [SAR324 cluster bacterium]
MSPGRKGLVLAEPLLFEHAASATSGMDLPDWDVAKSATTEIPAHLLRKSETGLPQLSEPEVVRHFTRLSTYNYSLDAGFYPLGSCTMKYNPKINDWVASLEGFANAHPYAPFEHNKGLLEILWEHKEQLKEISGMDEVCLHPAAGSHGELLGMMLICAYHEDRGDFKRTKVLIPDSAHGTNPSSAAICNLESVTLPSGPDGLIDMEALDKLMTDEVAGIMLTNPNTCGIFEINMKKVADLVHERGGQVYFDGANMNALVGIARPGDMNADVLHFNVHKTFSTPHGGGGPGAGPIGLKNHLAEFLPKPVLTKKEDFIFQDFNRPKSIGRIRSFYGNIGVLIRSWAFIKTLGGKGLTEMTGQAVLSANYMKARLQEKFHVPFDKQHCMHEVLLTDKNQEASTLDMAKGLIERGFHPPTIYFPLVVQGALLIEPTETESKESLDAFCDALLELATKSSEELHHLPETTFVQRVDETLAARKPILKWDLKP